MTDQTDHVSIHILLTRPFLPQWHNDTWAYRCGHTPSVCSHCTPTHPLETVQRYMIHDTKTSLCKRYNNSLALVSMTDQTDPRQHPSSPYPPLITPPPPANLSWLSLITVMHRPSGKTAHLRHYPPAYPDRARYSRRASLLIQDGNGGKKGGKSTHIHTETRTPKDQREQQ